MQYLWNRFFTASADIRLEYFAAISLHFRWKNSFHLNSALNSAFSILVSSSSALSLIVSHRSIIPFSLFLSDSLLIAAFPVGSPWTPSLKRPSPTATFR